MPNRSARLDRVFQALADPTRRAVLHRLGSGPAPVSELARPFRMALPSFAQHLDVLERSGLVRSRKAGRVRTYRLAPRSLRGRRALDGRAARPLGAAPRSTGPRPQRPQGAEAMTRPLVQRPDPRLDLFFERVVDVPAHLVWLAWTTPEHLKKWFTPAPWTTVDCEIELRPAGHLSHGDALARGAGIHEPGVLPRSRARAKGSSGPMFWARGFDRPTDRPTAPAPSSLSPRSSRLRRKVPVRSTPRSLLHGDEDSRAKHDAMGFQDGWGKALDQLVALAKTM